MPDRDLDINVRSNHANFGREGQIHHPTALSVTVGDPTVRSRQPVMSTVAGGGSGSGGSGAAKLSAKEQAAAEEAKAKLERMVKVRRNASKMRWPRADIVEGGSGPCERFP